MSITKFSLSISGRVPPIQVEYTDKNTGLRKTKRFEDSYKARVFFVSKDRKGCHPRVIPCQNDN